MLCPRREEIGPSSVFKLPAEDNWRDGKTCSYCGSLNPDEFMRAIEAGATITPTDKNYKAYLTDSVRGHQKFYFQHLDMDQRKKMVDLLNAGQLKFAFPGHFYVLPFFMAQQAKKG